MSLFDIICLIIIAGFGLFGLFFGLIQTIGSLLGTALGVFLAYRFYAPVSEWVINHTSWGENLSRVVIFIIVFIIIDRLVGLAFWGVGKLLGLITKLPFLNSTNRILGLIFGLFEGSLMLGAIFYFIARFPISDNFMNMLSNSQVAPHLVKMASVFIPFIPEAIQKLDSVIKNWM